MLQAVPAPKINTMSNLVDVADRLDDAKALTQALLMAAEGTTACDDVEINAISRLAWKISEDIQRARAIVYEALEARNA